MSETLCDPISPVSVDPRNITYRNLVDILMEAGRNILIFPSVLHGPGAEVAINETTQSPLLWIEDEARVQVQQGERVYTLGILALVQAQDPLKDEIRQTGNETSELSRMAQALDTLVAYLYKYYKYVFRNDGPRYDLLSLHREFTGRYVGWRMQITLYGAYDIDCCLPELPNEYNS
jgi:hypothetical protein